jgi:hypothetical protein
VLARLPGVGDVQFQGARQYAMRIWLDPDMVAAYRGHAREVRADDGAGGAARASQMSEPAVAAEPEGLAVSVTELLSRPPIAPQDDFDPEDRARFRQEIMWEQDEIRTILACLRRLKANPELDGARISTIIVLWWRCYANLERYHSAMITEGPVSDQIWETLQEARERWRGLQARAKRTLAEMQAKPCQ